MYDVCFYVRTPVNPSQRMTDIGPGWRYILSWGVQLAAWSMTLGGSARLAAVTRYGYGAGVIPPHHFRSVVYHMPMNTDWDMCDSCVQVRQRTCQCAANDSQTSARARPVERRMVESLLVTGLPCASGPVYPALDSVTASLLARSSSATIVLPARMKCAPAQKYAAVAMMIA